MPNASVLQKKIKKLEMPKQFSFSPEVLLIRPWNPSTAPEGSLVEDSLGVGYLAAALRKANISTVIVDAFTMRYGTGQIIDIIEYLQPRIIGFSLHSFADLKQVTELSTVMRVRQPNSYQIAGGEHASYLAVEILTAYPSLDAIIVSEGEQTIVDLSELVLKGFDPKFVPGALVKTEAHEIIDGGSRAAVEDLDQIPFPEKDIVETALLMNRPVALSLLSGRGCTHRCTFCTAHNFMRLGGGNVWRRRSPKSVIDELEMLYGHYYGRPGVHAMVQFQDVIFLGTSKRAREWTRDFLDELEARHLVIPFYIMSRSDAVIAHEPQLARLAANGLSSVEIGIETGVPRILLDYNKENSIDDLRKAIGLLKQHNICFDASGYIMFDPRMTLEEVRISANFLFELGHATWDRYITKLQVFPGTVLKTEFLAAGIFDPNAALDDVYAYTFQDSRVGNLAMNVYFYDKILQQLDIAIHNARALVADMKHQRCGEWKPIEGTILLAETLYHEFFNKLIDNSIQGTFEQEFVQLKSNFIHEAMEMNKLFNHIFTRETVDHLP